MPRGEHFADNITIGRTYAFLLFVTVLDACSCVNRAWFCLAKFPLQQNHTGSRFAA